MNLRLFGSAERKSDPTASLITTSLSPGPNQVVWPRDNVRKQANEGYVGNATVYQCVNIIARAAAGVPWILTRKDGLSPKGPTKKYMSSRTARKATDSGFYRARKSVANSEILDHPLLNLIEKPNPHQGGAAYTEAVFSWLLIAGQSFETFVGPDTGANKGKPLEMWVQRSDRMKVVTGAVASGELIGGYEYWVGASGNESLGDKFTVDQVLHQKKFHPLDDYVGLSPIRVIADLVDAENAAHRWNRKLLDNDCRPSVGIVVKSGLMSDARARFIAELKAMFSGKDNARKPLVLEGDIDIKTIALSPADMDFDNGLKQIRRIIAHAYNVPAQFVGDTESQSYASAQEAHKELFQDNILPELDRRRDNLNAKLTVKFGDEYRLDYDTDQIEALHEDTQRVYTYISTADYLSVNEQRAAVGSDDSTHENANIPRCFLPSTAPVVPHVPVAAGPAAHPPGDPATPPADPLAAKAVQIAEASRKRHEERLQRQWEKRFKAQRRELLKSIDKHLGLV